LRDSRAGFVEDIARETPRGLAMDYRTNKSEKAENYEMKEFEKFGIG
jgi:hypothetical protein